MIDAWLNAIRAQPLIDRVALLCFAAMALTVVLIVPAVVYGAINEMRSQD